MIGSHEAFAISKKLGVDHHALFSMPFTSAGQCRAVTIKGPVPGQMLTSPANRNCRLTIATVLMLKDLRLAAQAVAAAGAATPLLGDSVRQEETFDKSGQGGKDSCTTITHLHAGVP